MPECACMTALTPGEMFPLGAKILNLQLKGSQQTGRTHTHTSFPLWQKEAATPPRLIPAGDNCPVPLSCVSSFWNPLTWQTLTSASLPSLSCADWLPPALQRASSKVPFLLSHLFFSQSSSLIQFSRPDHVAPPPPPLSPVCLLAHFSKRDIHNRKNLSRLQEAISQIFFFFLPLTDKQNVFQSVYLQRLNTSLCLRPIFRERGQQQKPTLSVDSKLPSRPNKKQHMWTRGEHESWQAAGLPAEGRHFVGTAKQCTTAESSVALETVATGNRKCLSARAPPPCHIVSISDPNLTFGWNKVWDKRKWTWQKSRCEL